MRIKLQYWSQVRVQRSSGKQQEALVYKIFCSTNKGQNPSHIIDGVSAVSSWFKCSRPFFLFRALWWDLKIRSSIIFSTSATLHKINICSCLRVKPLVERVLFRKGHFRKPATIFTRLVHHHRHNKNIAQYSGWWTQHDMFLKAVMVQQHTNSPHIWQHSQKVHKIDYL